MNLTDKQLKSINDLSIDDKAKVLSIIEEISKATDVLNQNSDLIKALTDILKTIESKEEKIYVEELKTIYLAILDIEKAINEKDLVVNVESDKPELEKINKSILSLIEQHKKMDTVEVNLILE